MSALPRWAYDRMKRLNVIVERFGRVTPGRPSTLERTWFFCGWYYHRAKGNRVMDGPHGPFPCMSAAIAHALRRYGKGRENHGRDY